MSVNHDVNVGHCVVELTPIKQDKGSTCFDSSSFVFQSSQCRIRINYGWDTNERKIRIYVKGQPILSPNFYATLTLFKGSHCISSPKKQVQETVKCIWSLSASDIAQQLPGVEICDLKFRFEFQQEAESNYDQKNSGKLYDVFLNEILCR